jgi:poly-gamma-glutamate synthesis protein (capsule biosynthesis protein)
MVHSTQYNYARIDSTHFDFNPVFKFIKPYLSKSDFTFGNLETVIGGKELGWKGYPKFNSPEEFVAALKNAGFDLLFTANNHALDQGEYGVKKTIEAIKKYGMACTGTYRKGDKNYQILYKGLLRIAVAAFSYGTNGFHLPDTTSYLINKIRRKEVRNTLKEIRRNESPDLIIVYFHFGDEYKRTPSDFQLDYVNYAFRYGADVVIGSHPHVIQSIAWWRDKDNIKGRFVAYSLGNFISNQTWRYSDCGMILNFSFRKNIKTGSARITNLNFLPTWVYKGPDERGKLSYFILPTPIILNSKTKPSFITEDDIRRMKESLEDTELKVNEMGANIPVWTK